MGENLDPFDFDPSDDALEDLSPEDEHHNLMLLGVAPSKLPDLEERKKYIEFLKKRGNLKLLRL